MSGKRIRRPSVISSAKQKETEQSKLIASHFTTRYILCPQKAAMSGDPDSTETAGVILHLFAASGTTCLVPQCAEGSRQSAAGSSRQAVSTRSKAIYHSPFTIHNS